MFDGDIFHEEKIHGGFYFQFHPLLPKKQERDLMKSADQV